MDPIIATCVEQVKTAQKILNKKVLEKFPVGARIRWKWQGADQKHIQFGEVVWVSDCWWGDPRIRVRNERTGKIVDLNLGHEPERL